MKPSIDFFFWIAESGPNFTFYFTVYNFLNKIISLTSAEKYMKNFSSKDRAMRRFKYEILYLLYIYYIIFKYKMKVSRSANCSLTVMFSFIVSFFCLNIQSSYTRNVSFWVQGGWGEGISVQLCSASFVFLHFYFSNVAHCGGKIEKNGIIWDWFETESVFRSFMVSKRPYFCRSGSGLRRRRKRMLVLRCI